MKTWRLLIFQIDGASGFYFYDGTAWTLLSGGSSSISGLEEITEAGNTGHRIAGRDTANYGDIGNKRLDENYSPMQPISTYGASKLACEALISSYSYMFDIKASALRFGNVVGGRQTHGVGYDFIRKLINNPYTISVMGNGSQSKPYIHVDDVVKIYFYILKNLSESGIYDVGTGKGVLISEIISKLKLDNKYIIKVVRYYSNQSDKPLTPLTSIVGLGAR